MQLVDFVANLNPKRYTRVAGTAIFLAREVDYAPLALLHALKHYKVLHERTVVMMIETADVPQVPDEGRCKFATSATAF